MCCRHGRLLVLLVPALEKRCERVVRDAGVAEVGPTSALPTPRRRRIFDTRDMLMMTTTSFPASAEAGHVRPSWRTVLMPHEKRERQTPAMSSPLLSPNGYDGIRASAEDCCDVDHPARNLADKQGLQRERRQRRG